MQGDVKLTSALDNFQQVPVKFNEVNGSFDISDNVTNLIKWFS